MQSQMGGKRSINNHYKHTKLFCIIPFMNAINRYYWTDRRYAMPILISSKICSVYFVYTSCLCHLPHKLWIIRFMLWEYSACKLAVDWQDPTITLLYPHCYIFTSSTSTNIWSHPAKIKSVYLFPYLPKTGRHTFTLHDKHYLRTIYELSTNYLREDTINRWRVY